MAELGFGNSNVFSQTFVEKFNKAYFHISVDAIVFPLSRKGKYVDVEGTFIKIIFTQQQAKN